MNSDSDGSSDECEYEYPSSSDSDSDHQEQVSVALCRQLQADDRQRAAPARSPRPEKISADAPRFEWQTRFRKLIPVWGMAKGRAVQGFEAWRSILAHLHPIDLLSWYATTQSMARLCRTQLGLPVMLARTLGHGSWFNPWRLQRALVAYNELGTTFLRVSPSQLGGLRRKGEDSPGWRGLFGWMQTRPGAFPGLAVVCCDGGRRRIEVPCTPPVASSEGLAGMGMDGTALLTEAIATLSHATSLSMSELSHAREQSNASWWCLGCTLQNAAAATACAACGGVEHEHWGAHTHGPAARAAAAAAAAAATAAAAVALEVAAAAVVAARSASEEAAAATVKIGPYSDVCEGCAALLAQRPRLEIHFSNATIRVQQPPDDTDSLRAEATAAEQHLQRHGGAIVFSNCVVEGALTSAGQAADVHVQHYRYPPLPSPARSSAAGKDGEGDISGTVLEAMAGVVAMTGVVAMADGTWRGRVDAQGGPAPQTAVKYHPRITPPNNTTK